jgi:hypothetical protein
LLGNEKNKLAKADKFATMAFPEYGRKEEAFSTARNSDPSLSFLFTVVCV